MRRRDRPETWGLWGMFEPVVPRDLRIEVEERVLADGHVHTALDADQVRAAARDLLDRGVQSVAIFFMNSYANDANERAAAESLERTFAFLHTELGGTGGELETAVQDEPAGG